MIAHGGPRPACRRGVVFRTKPEIALDQIRAALAAGVPRGVVLADAGYGIDTAFRSGIDGDGLDLHRRHPVLDEPVAAGNGASAGQSVERRGRPPSLVRRDPEHKPARPRNWRRPCRRGRGAASPGGRAPKARSPRALPLSASGRRIGITGAPHRGPRNGS